MNRNMTALSLLVVLSATPLAQDQAAGPQVERLERYLGTWHYEGEDATPVTGGRVVCDATRRWISGGYFIESHRDCKTPRGELKQVEVFGYDFQKHLYLYWGFNGQSVSTYVASTMDGDAVTWTGTGLSEGNRCIELFTSGSGSSSSKCETTTDGGNSWILRASGRSTRSR
jgi:hypothetical protein